MSTQKKEKVEKPKKHRKILRGNIAGVTKPALARLFHRAGVKRISGIMYEEARARLQEYLEDIMKDIVVFVDHDNRKTVQIKDVYNALQQKGIELAAGLNPNAKKTASLQSCNSRGKSGTKHSTPSDDTEKKPHRFRPGTVAVRSIRYQQKNSDCLAIPKINFARLTIEVCQNYYEDRLRFAHGVFDLIQLVVEDYMINMFAAANLCAHHAGRETVMPSDIILVQQIKDMV